MLPPIPPTCLPLIKAILLRHTPLSLQAHYIQQGDMPPENASIRLWTAVSVNGGGRQHAAGKMDLHKPSVQDAISLGKLHVRRGRVAAVKRVTFSGMSADGLAGTGSHEPSECGLWLEHASPWWVCVFPGPKTHCLRVSLPMPWPLKAYFARLEQTNDDRYRLFRGHLEEPPSARFITVPSIGTTITPTIRTCIPRPKTDTASFLTFKISALNG